MQMRRGWFLAAVWSMVLPMASSVGCGSNASRGAGEGAQPEASPEAAPDGSPEASPEGSPEGEPEAVNTPPIARITGPATISRRSRWVSLDGQGSVDPEGAPLAWRWRQVGGASLSLSGLDGPTLEFGGPSEAGQYGFELIVNDGELDSAPAVFTLEVTNAAPVADAGPDLNAPILTLIHVDGSGSLDPDGDGLRYNWTQVDGTFVELVNSDLPVVEFVTPRRPVTITLELVVSDGHLSSEGSRVQIVVGNGPPVADAGQDRRVSPSLEHRLDASGSVDPDQNPLTFSWRQIDGPYARLSLVDEPMAAFNPLETGRHVFEVTVSDGQDSDTDTVVFEVGEGFYTGQEARPEGNPFRAEVPMTGYISDIAARDGEVFVLQEHSGIKVFDDASMAQIGSLQIIQRLKRMALSGDLIVLASEVGGLIVVDAADPAAMVEVGRLRLAGQPTDVSVTGDLALVATEPAMIHVVDVSNPAAPALLATVDLGGRSKAMVHAEGERAFALNTADGRVTILDLSDPSNPVEIGVVDAATNFLTRDVFARGDRLTVSGGNGGVSVWSVENPGEPVLIGSYESDLDPTHLALVGDVALLSSSDRGLAVVDLSNPADPELVAHYDTPGATSAAAVSGPWIFIADGWSGLQRVSLAPDLPQIRVPHLEVPTFSTWDVFVRGSNTFLATGQGLMILDTSVAGTFEVVGRLDVPGISTDVEVVDDVAFLVADDLHIIDISELSRPRELSRFEAVGVDRVVLTGDVALLTAREAGVLVLDVSDLRAPRQIAALRTSNPFDLAVDGDRVYVTAGAGLHVFDIAAPADPRLLSRLPNTQARIFWALEVVDGALWASVEPSQLARVDLSNPLIPKIDRLVATPREVGFGMFASQGLLYLPSRDGAVQLFDISRPDRPLLVGVQESPSEVLGVHADRGVAFAAVEYYGIQPVVLQGGALDDHEESATPNQRLTFTLRGFDPAMALSCQVTGGECAIESVDRVGRTATISWQTPAVVGDFEIAVTAGSFYAYQIVGRAQAYLR